MIIAAVNGHTSVLKILANHPDINLSEQVSITGRSCTLKNRQIAPEQCGS